MNLVWKSRISIFWGTGEREGGRNLSAVQQALSNSQDICVLSIQFQPQMQSTAPCGLLEECAPLQPDPKHVVKTHCLLLKDTERFL